MVSGHKLTLRTVGPIIHTLAEAKAALADRDTALKACAAKLREQRQAVDVPLRAVAKQMRRSASYVSDVELGRRALSPEFATAHLKAVKLLTK